MFGETDCLDATARHKFQELESALYDLVAAHIRAITPKDQMADSYESLYASSEATKAISAFLTLKTILGASDAIASSPAVNLSRPGLQPCAHGSRSIFQASNRRRYERRPEAEASGRCVDEC